MAQQPWASGSGEILQHGLDLLKKDTDVTRRLALISIDNSVELMMKTYLGLPKRITGLKLSRKEFQEISESFPALLDALEQHANDKLDGVDLGSIEWFHRLRNELYHQGNGLTVERDKVIAYAEHARLLFKNLFGVEISVSSDIHMERFGQFISMWGKLEQLVLRVAAQDGGSAHVPVQGAIRQLRIAGIVDDLVEAELIRLRLKRNKVAHGEDPSTVSAQDLARLTEIALQLQSAMEGPATTFMF